VVNYVVLDNSGSQIQPDDFTVVDDNQVTLGFVSDRTGIANIFACVDDTVTFAGGVFANLVAVTGTFTEGITVGSGTTFITGAGIDTPELKIAGQTPNFGGGGGALEYIATYQDDGGIEGVQFDIPSGYIRFEVHIQNVQHLGVNDTQTFECRTASEATPNIFGTVTTDSVAGSASVGTSAMTYSNATESSGRFFLHRNTINDGMGNDAFEKWNGVLYIMNPGSDNDYASFTFQGAQINEGGATAHVAGAAIREETSRINSMLLRGNAVQTFEITVHLYGYPTPEGFTP
jgi:hypothetical protein